MALSKDQKAWLDALGSGAVEAVKDADRREKKAKALTDASAALDGERDRIRAEMQKIMVKVDPTGFKENLIALFNSGKVDRPFLTPDSDAMKEFDVGRHKDSAEFKKGHVDKLANLMGPIMAEAKKLRDATDDDGVPLFDPDKPDEFAKAFYEPLVREGIIPENAVADQFSEVSRTMEGAMGLYDERLKAYSMELSKPQKILDTVDLPVSLLAAGAQAASGAWIATEAARNFGIDFTSADAMLASDKFKAETKVPEIIAGAAACLSSAKKAADAVVTKGDLQTAGDVMVASIGKLLTPIIGKDATKVFTNIATVACHAAPLGQAVYKEDISALLKQLGNSIGDSLLAANSDPAYRTAAAAIKGEFAALSKIAETAKDNSDAYTKILQAAVGAGTAAGREIANTFKDRATADLAQRKSTMSKEDYDQAKIDVGNFFKAIDGGEKFADEKAEAGIALQDTLKKLAKKTEDSVNKTQLEELKKKANKATEEQLQALLSAPDAEFQRVLEFGFAQDEDDPAAKGISEEMRLKSLETLLADLQRRQKMVDLATAIANGGVGAVEKLVPGLSAVAAGTKTIVAMAETVQKYRQLLTWSQNMKDAKAAVTVQYEVMVNRYGLQREQTIASGLNALIQAIDTIGKAMMAAGHLAPIGVAVSVASSSADAVIKASLKATTKAKMAAAWKTYKAALENPNDRITAREALRENPTLAKYALAWGAVHDGNRIAQSALDSCGITEASLQTPGADVAKVVKYLETYFRDDPQLLREVPVAEKWYPGEIELTVPSWLAFHKAAESHATPSFKDTMSGNVAGRLHALTLQLDEVEDAKKRNDAEDIARQTGYAVQRYDELIAVLSRYKPLDTDKKPHPTMTTYVVAVEARATRERNALAA